MRLRERFLLAHSVFIESKDSVVELEYNAQKNAMEKSNSAVEARVEALSRQRPGCTCLNPLNPA